MAHMFASPPFSLCLSLYLCHICLTSSSTHTVGRGLWQQGNIRFVFSLVHFWYSSPERHLLTSTFNKNTRLWEHLNASLSNPEDFRICRSEGQTGSGKDLFISRAFGLVVTSSIYYDVIGLQRVEPEMWCRWGKRLPVCVCVLHLTSLCLLPPVYL